MPTARSKSSSHSVGAGVIAGAVVGSVLGTLLILGLLYGLYRWSKNRRTGKNDGAESLAAQTRYLTSASPILTLPTVSSPPLSSPGTSPPPLSELSNRKYYVSIFFDSNWDADMDGYRILTTQVLIRMPCSDSERWFRSQSSLLLTV